MKLEAPIVLIYAFKNRDLTRVKRTLDSLVLQSNQNFRVEFVNYGSSTELTKELELLIGDYSFVKYNYLAYQNQPWNKSRALNYIIKKIEEPFFFISDIDIIFHPKFINLLHDMKDKDKMHFYKVGYLSEKETLLQKSFEDYQVEFYSKVDAKGMTLFPTEIVRKNRGFDEFYHFWGAEDADIHFRLSGKGCESVFYEEETLLLHQWHTSYRKTESKELTKNLQIKGIVQINHQHLFFNQQDGVTINYKQWGEVSENAVLEELDNVTVNQVILNRKVNIDHFIYGILPNVTNTVITVKFTRDSYEKSLKYKVKKILGKKVPEYYTLKEVNDLVLLHLISFYRDCPYSYKITADLEAIELRLKL